MYETFDHKADIGVRGFGKTIEASFEQTAKAMFNVMVEIHAVESKEGVDIKCQAEDKELLLVEWLNALLAEADVNEMVFCDFHVNLRDNTIDGLAKGEKLIIEKHKPKTEVKGATYSNLRVYEQSGKWISQCIIDV